MCTIWRANGAHSLQRRSVGQSDEDRANPQFTAAYECEDALGNAGAYKVLSQFYQRIRYDYCPYGEVTKKGRCI